MKVRAKPTKTGRRDSAPGARRCALPRRPLSRSVKKPKSTTCSFFSSDLQCNAYLLLLLPSATRLVACLEVSTFSFSLHAEDTHGQWQWQHLIASCGGKKKKKREEEEEAWAILYGKKERVFFFFFFFLLFNIR